MATASQESLIRRVGRAVWRWGLLAVALLLLPIWAASMWFGVRVSSGPYALAVAQGLVTVLDDNGDRAPQVFFYRVNESRGFGLRRPRAHVSAEPGTPWLVRIPLPYLVVLFATPGIYLWYTYVPPDEQPPGQAPEN